MNKLQDSNFANIDFDLDYDFYKSQHQKPKHFGTNTDYQSQDQSTTTYKPSKTIKFQVEADRIVQTQKQPSEPPQLTKDQEKKLQDFLKRASKLVIHALKENDNLTLIHKFEPLQTGIVRETTQIFCLTAEHLHEITDIQWNSNGLTIAASYSKLEHEGSCDHKSSICLWNLNKRDFDPQKPLQLETQGCVMCISYHPTKPSVLAAGLFTGQILIFDFSISQNELCKSYIDEYFHRESITQLAWVENRLGTVNLYNYQKSLISLGTDGKLLVWAINLNEMSMSHPIKGHILLRKKESQIESVGGTCLSQFHDDSSNFIIGSEGGSVLRGLIQPVSEKKSALGQMKWSEQAQSFMGNMNQKFLPEIIGQVEQYCKQRNITEIQVKHILLAKPDIRKLYINPITFAYEAHYGTVFGISDSPFIHGLFVTCSMDGQVRLYDVSNARSLKTFEYLSHYVLSVQFSPVRPCVFAACTSGGELLLFDLKENNKGESKTIRPTEIMSSQSATNVRFNQRQQDLLACSYTNGQIRIFQLSDQFTRFQKDEDTFLESLLN